MRQIAIVMNSREAAGLLQAALSDFAADVVEQDDRGFRVEVALTRADQVAAVLTALRSYVTSHEFEPAAVEVDGTRYMLHAD